MDGAMAAMRHLPDLVRKVEARLRIADRPIENADIEELFAQSGRDQKNDDDEMASELANLSQKPDTEWDQKGYATLVAPTAQMANSPQSIIDLTLAAANNGAKSAQLLYELMLAEMKVAIARFYVTLNTGIKTE